MKEGGDDDMNSKSNLKKVVLLLFTIVASKLTKLKERAGVNYTSGIAHAE